MLAAVRPDSVNVPLFVHVLGAMLLVGTLVVVAVTLLAAWRRSDAEAAGALTRFGLRTLLIGVLPSYIVMRIGAQWTEAEENIPEDADLAWLGVGYITADLGAVLMLVAIVLAVLGLRRLRATPPRPAFGRAVAVIAVTLLAAYIVAVWAMTAKPG